MRCPFGANGTWRFLEAAAAREGGAGATVDATWDLTQV
jgi:hypothetical protein